MTRLFWHILAIVGVLGCLQHCAGPAHAREVTLAALAELCPGHEDLAPHIDQAARRYLLSPVVLVAVMRVESHCRMDVRGKASERCAFQVRGVARNGRTNDELADPATCIDTGARWLSIMETWAGTLPGGLGAYNSGKRGRGHGKYARKVLAAVARAWRAIDDRRETRS